MLTSRFNASTCTCCLGLRRHVGGEADGGGTLTLVEPAVSAGLYLTSSSRRTSTNGRWTWTWPRSGDGDGTGLRAVGVPRFSAGSSTTGQEWPGQSGLLRDDVFVASFQR